MGKFEQSARPSSSSLGSIGHKKKRSFAHYFQAPATQSTFEPLVWRRFIDDIFMVWKEGEEHQAFIVNYHEINSNDEIKKEFY